MNIGTEPMIYLVAGVAMTVLLFTLAYFLDINEED